MIYLFLFDYEKLSSFSWTLWHFLSLPVEKAKQLHPLISLKA